MAQPTDTSSVLHGIIGDNKKSKDLVYLYWLGVFAKDSQTVFWARTILFFSDFSTLGSSHFLDNFVIAKDDDPRSLWAINRRPLKRLSNAQGNFYEKIPFSEKIPLVVAWLFDFHQTRNESRKLQQQPKFSHRRPRFCCTSLQLRFLFFLFFSFLANYSSKISGNRLEIDTIKQETRPLFT